MIIRKWNMHLYRKVPTGKEGHLSKIPLIPRNTRKTCVPLTFLPEFPEFLD